MRHWTFRDYISQQGRNVIREWVDAQPIQAQMDLDNFIRQLEAQERLREPRMKKLSDVPGIFELRLLSCRVQYRPLACYGPGRRDVTILTGAIEKGGQLEPRDAKKIARLRKSVIEHDPSRSREHEFD